MTAAEFLAFYPQFTSVIPEAVLSAYVDSANLRFTDFGADAPEARRLYVAHKLTLYAKTMPAAFSDASSSGSASATYASLASAGDGSKITSKKVDGVAVTYSSGSSASSASGSGSSLADLSETIFGEQLLTLIRLYSYPRYVP